MLILGKIVKYTKTGNLLVSFYSSFHFFPAVLTQFFDKLSKQPTTELHYLPLSLSYYNHNATLKGATYSGANHWYCPASHLRKIIFHLNLRLGFACFYFEMGFHVAQTGFKVVTWPRMTLNFILLACITTFGLCDDVLDWTQVVLTVKPPKKSWVSIYSIAVSFKVPVERLNRNMRK